MSSEYQSVAIQTWQQNKKPALSWFSVDFYYDTFTLMDIAAYMYFWSYWAC